MAFFLFSRVAPGYSGSFFRNSLRSSPHWFLSVASMTSSTRTPSTMSNVGTTRTTSISRTISMIFNDIIYTYDILFIMTR